MRGFSRATSDAPVDSKFFAELGVPMTRSFAAASESGRPIMIKKATAFFDKSVPA